MLIDVVCPHCEGHFSLRPDLAGKLMRCPACREVFEVRSAERPPAPEPPPLPLAELPAGSAGQVSDFVPMLEAEAAPAAQPDRPYERVEVDPLVPVLEGAPVAADEVPVALLPGEPPPARRSKKKKRKDLPAARVPVGPAPADLPVAESDDGPREVVWSAGTAAPPPAGRVAADAPPVDTGLDDLIAKRKRRRNTHSAVLAGVLTAIALVLGVIGYSVLRYYYLTEKNLAEQAAAEFEKQNYPKAAEVYDELRTRFGSSSDADRHRFFHDLAALHVLVGGAAVKDNPAAAKGRFDGFVAEHGGTELAKPQTGFGESVYAAGRKLLDAFAVHAEGRLGNFNKSNKARRDELAAAEAAVATGEGMVPGVDKFRDPAVAPLDEQRRRFAGLAAEFRRERHRLAVLDPFRGIVADPSEARINEFSLVLARNQLAGDTEANHILEQAKRRLRELIVFAADPRPPVAPPAEPGGFLFVAAATGAAPAGPARPEGRGEVFFATVRGVLSALDAATGDLLWAARVGSQSAGRTAEDVPPRTTLGDGGPEVVLVPGNVGGRPAVAARDARTGEVYWHQPLEAACAGEPVLADGRLYVPLRDADGTVVEIEVGNGTRLGAVKLRQPLGPGAVLRAGTGLVYVPAAARRVFVLDTDARADGERRPKCVQVLVTGHPEASARVAPVVAGPPGEEGAGARYLVLSLTDGPRAMRLRAFALPPVDRAVAPPPELAPAVAAEATLPGWAWFPPSTDGERLAAVTDAGAFGVFGVNLPGNRDPGLFDLPRPTAEAEGAVTAPAPGLVAAAAEDEFWVVQRGNLVRMRASVRPAAGYQVAAVGSPTPVGDPVQPAQAADRLDLVCVVTRDDGSGEGRAVAFDPETGVVRWDRRLGAVPAAEAIPLPNGSAVVVAETGAAYTVPPAALPPPPGTRPADPGWVSLPPAPNPTGRPLVAAAAGGGVVWVLTAEGGEKGPRLRGRRVGGKPEEDVVVPLPGRIAGEPIAHGGGVLVPLADGQVYRLAPGGRQLAIGPMWRGVGVGPDARCFLAAAGGDEFVGTDGGRRVQRWRWPAGDGAEWEKVGGPIAVRGGNVLFAPAVVGRRVFVADPGGVAVFDLDRPTSPLRQWAAKPGDPALPAGPPTRGFLVFQAADGKPVAVYAVGGRHLVAVSPDDGKPVWVKPGDDGRFGGDLLGWAAAGDRVVATDQTGRVTVLDAFTGRTVGEHVPAADAIPPAARGRAVPLGPGRLLLVLADGTAVTLPVPGE